MSSSNAFNLIKSNFFFNWLRVSMAQTRVHVLQWDEINFGKELLFVNIITIFHVSIFKNVIGKECHLVMGNISLSGYNSEYFPHAKNLRNYFLCSTAFADKIIRGYITCNLFYLLVVIYGEIFYLQRERSAKKTCALRRLLHSWIFLLFGKYFPILTTSR